MLLAVYARGPGLRVSAPTGTRCGRRRTVPRTADARAAAITLLALGTVLTTVEAEILVGALEPALKPFGMTELFAGVIVVALVGNAAEHYSAISAASKTR